MKISFTFILFTLDHLFFKHFTFMPINLCTLNLFHLNYFYFFPFFIVFFFSFWESKPGCLFYWMNLKKNYIASRKTKGAISLGIDSFFIVVFSFILDMSICYVWMYSPSFAHRHTKSNGFKGKINLTPW